MLPTPMDALLRRRLALQALGGLLAAAWAAHAGLTLALAAVEGVATALLVLPSLAALALAAGALARPVRVASPRSAVGAILLGTLALLLSVALLGSALDDASEVGRIDVMPAAEEVYGHALAFGATALFGLLGILQGWRREPTLGHRTVLAALALGTGLTVAGSLAWANAWRLDGHVDPPANATAASFGPPGLDVELPGCGTLPSLGSSAQLRMTGRGTLDGKRVAESTLFGVRDGLDESWTVDWWPVEGAPTGLGAGWTEYARIGDEAWLRSGTPGDDRSPAAPWRTVSPDPFGLAGPGMLTVDGPVLGLLAGEGAHGPPAGAQPPAEGGEVEERAGIGREPGPGAPGREGTVALIVEDRGTEVLGGAAARHCASLVGGTAALDAFVVLRWMLADEEAVAQGRLSEWRGELDWWVFGDGALGRATVRVGGRGGDAWPEVGPRGLLEAEVVALDRGAPASVEPPAGALESAAR
jgi:hypothetical protein